MLRSFAEQYRLSGLIVLGECYEGESRRQSVDTQTVRNACAMAFGVDLVRYMVCAHRPWRVRN